MDYVAFQEQKMKTNTASQWRESMVTKSVPAEPDKRCHLYHSPSLNQFFIIAVVYIVTDCK